jgi:hypothetical protein
MEAVLIIIAVFVLLAIGSAAVVRRRRAAHTEAAPQPSPSRSHGDATADGPGRDDLILVPLPNRRDEALILGSSRALDVLDASGLTERPSDHAPGPLPQLVRSAMATGGIKSTRRAQDGIDSGRIVALSKETMGHLDKGKPVFDKAGNMLGIVKGEKDKISHVMRFDKRGAQAVVASHAATLAVTAALSQQLDQIAEQLADISETLEGMVRDKDRERLSEVAAANELLVELANNVRRRGIDQADAYQLANIKLPVFAKQLEAEFKFNEVLGEGYEKLSRKERLDRLGQIVEKERLAYWLALTVQADLARTRADFLTLYWEHHQHPETAGFLNAATERAVVERQERLAAIGQTLRELSDPKALTRMDPLRQHSRYRLGKEHKKLKELLVKHGTAFAGPDADPFALLPAAAQVPDALPHGDA